MNEEELNKNDGAKIDGAKNDGAKIDGDKIDGDNVMSDDGDSEYSDMNEEELMAKITNFPVQIIALERCEGTLDSLIMEEDVSDDEWGSIIIQILMTLITLQEKFHLTHNDLHTNNIMYTTTDKEYLYYKLDGKHYKVPTYGRIYKIIDFGRAIYKFRGNLMCSDSFHNKGDAATQYNCEPYLNKNKPNLDPNYSFDLCRLGCALFDFIIDEEEDDNEDIDKIKSPILKIIAGWCKDDKGRNIMYKNNGEERYPDFKLYKMIARTVTNHIPSKVIDNPYFDRFIENKKKIKLSKNQTIMDIDAIPKYTELI
jgi:serine/threonine protein kinase